MFSGRFFREILLEFQGSFGEVSQSFSGRKFGKRRGKEGRGCGGGGKLKSADGKNEVCDPPKADGSASIQSGAGSYP